MFKNKIKKDFDLPQRPAPARHSHLGDGGRLCGENFGFSLIEVLVSMTVLIVIIIMVTDMFRNASEAWDTGTQRAEMNTAARAAVEYIARELSCAVAGSFPDSAGLVQRVKYFYLDRDADNNVRDLSFIALSGTNHPLRGVRFRYNNVNRIIETVRELDSFQPYDFLLLPWSWPIFPSPPTAQLLITNVWRFSALVYTNESDMTSGHFSSSPYDSTAHNDLLPACVDISIEMLNERDMMRVQSLQPALVDGFVMTNSRVYTTRVCFPNRGGGK